MNGKPDIEKMMHKLVSRMGRLEAAVEIIAKRAELSRIDNILAMRGDLEYLKVAVAHIQAGRVTKFDDVWMEQWRESDRKLRAAAKEIVDDMDANPMRRWPLAETGDDDTGAKCAECGVAMIGFTAVGRSTCGHCGTIYWKGRRRSDQP